jgi:GTP-binding protein EngB required for normal cell division
MAKYETKNIRKFQEEGIYNPDTYIVTSMQKGHEDEETNLVEILTKMSSDGSPLKIVITKEDKIDEIEFDEDVE